MLVSDTTQITSNYCQKLIIITYVNVWLFETVYKSEGE